MKKQHFFHCIFIFKSLSISTQRIFQWQILEIITTLDSIVTFREKELIKDIFSGVSAQLEILIH